MCADKDEPGPGLTDAGFYALIRRILSAALKGDSRRQRNPRRQAARQMEPRAFAATFPPSHQM